LKGKTNQSMEKFFFLNICI